MSYDPDLPTIRDRIRKMIGDTDPSKEFFLDATYDAEIALVSSWKLAGASMAESLAVVLEQRVTNFSAQGDISVGWSDRTRSLRLLAARLRSEAAAEEAGIDSTVVSVGLTRGGSTTSEYRTTNRYRRLWR